MDAEKSIGQTSDGFTRSVIRESEAASKAWVSNRKYPPKPSFQASNGMERALAENNAGPGKPTTPTNANT